MNKHKLTQTQKTHIPTYTHLLASKHTYINTCIHIYVNTYKHIHTQIHTCTHIHYTYIYIYTYKDIYIYTYIHTYTYMHTHTHIHSKSSCSLLVNPSHTGESWEGRNTCMWISIYLNILACSLTKYKIQKTTSYFHRTF